MSARFTLALDRIEPARWQLFEHLASEFLSDEFGALRTMANMSGDGGRDAELFQPEGDASVALQYSIADDWEDKIRRTARTIAEKHPAVTVLVYATNRQLGAQADGIKQSVRKDFHLHTDIRDGHWFAEREQRSEVTRRAAETFSRAIVDPYLADAGVIDPTGAVLTNHEARAALLYLVLQREDDDADRQLTKLCFDALARAVLRNTDPENRLARSFVHDRIRELLPSHDRDEVALYVDRALERLDKRFVRHYRQADDFCLNFDERRRLAEGVARLELLNEEFAGELLDHLRVVGDALECPIDLADTSDLLVRARRVMERFLFERGEAFVEGLKSGQTMLFVHEELAELATQDVAQHADTTSLRHNLVSLIAQGIERTLRSPTEGVQHYLRAVADAYTLFAFLRETPNVQSAVSKLFAHGELWLDTSALLPVLAEDLVDPQSRRHTPLLHAARDAGVKLYVTRGVLEEIAAHLESCLVAWRSPKAWRSRTPFLLSVFVWSGRPPTDFPKWVTNFRGDLHPREDVGEYLEEVHGIRVHDLTDICAKAPDDLRWHAGEYWREVHEHRRGTGRTPPDPEVVRQLTAHDVENFVGVIARREGEEIGNPFGYSSWWLTLDSRAYIAAQDVATRCGLARIDSPVLSYDFLTYYLAVGPARAQLQRSRERTLPLTTDTTLLDILPDDLMQAAEAVRAEFEGEEERVIRRKVRDHLEREKLKSSSSGRSAIEALEDDIRVALEAGVKR